jgi:hypothetical protein
MGKLFELLAVEPDLQGAYKRILEEAKGTFSKKEGLFQGHVRELKMFDASLPEAPIERTELSTTVNDKLKYVFQSINQYFDALLQKEESNQRALAPLKIENIVFSEGLPATFLLGMESRLKELRQVIDEIPTLQPGVKWVRDETIGKHVYRTEYPEEKFRTAKTFKHQVLYPATDKHPAQIEKWEETENTGKYILTRWSGMISSAEKSDILERVDTLIRAVKKARQQANTEEVKALEIGEKITNYILGK